jgi:uncharacterized protein YecT (DUF1311 family)
VPTARDEAATARLLAGLVLAAALVAPARAPAQAPAACENARSTAAMRQCEIARLRRAEEGMDAAYRALAARLDAAGRAKLRAAQRAWLAYRAAEAGFRADRARDGTLAPLIAESVRADLTEARRRDLEQALGRQK